MPWPYVTNCLDRPSMEQGNKGECYEHCLNKSTVELFSSYPMEITLTTGRMSIIDHSHNSTFQQLKSQCKIKCKQSDCSSTTFIAREINYQPFYVSEENNQTNATVFTHFHFSISDKPNIRVLRTPKIILIDFITFVLGCPCFWFGVAPLPLLIHLSDWITLKKETNHTLAIGQLEQKVQEIDRHFDQILAQLLQLRRQNRKKNTIASLWLIKLQRSRQRKS